jgi:acyl-coenzyme A thioesterase PaaI-like protein
MAIKSILPPYTHFATTHVQARYLKGVKQGIVTAQAKLTGRKDRVIIGEVSLYNDSEEQVLDFTAQFKIARDAKLKQVTFADDHN